MKSILSRNISKDDLLEIESWAGAATKVSGYIGMIAELTKKQDYKPDVIVGVSSGSIAGLIRIVTIVSPSSIIPLVKLGKGFDLDDIFNKKPFNEESKLTLGAIARGIKGALSLGEHLQLRDTLKRFYTKEIWEEYVTGDYPDLILCSVDIDTGSYIMHNAKRLTYEDTFLHILSSSAIPGIMKPLLFNNNKVMDGGIRYSNAGWYVIYKMLNDGYKIHSHVSLYSRPQDISKEINSSLELKRTRFFKGILSILGRSISIMMFQNSKFCEFTEQQLAEKEGYDLYQYFLPKILDNSLDVEKKQLEQLYYAGMKSVAKLDKKY
jgi:hypothetical protein